MDWSFAMRLKPVLYGASALVCGIVAFALYSMEGSRLAVRQQGAAVQGKIVRSWTTRSRRASAEQHWVTYSYEVDGASFTGEERHVYGPLLPGGPIRVWFDPRSPGRCVSDPELRYGRDLKGTFIAGFMGFFALLATLKELFRRPPPAVKA